MGNSIGKEIEGKFLIIREQVLKPRYRKPHIQVFMATGGFGTSSFTSGRCVVGWYAYDGTHSRLDGYDFERFATREEVEDALKHNKEHMTYSQIFGDKAIKEIDWNAVIGKD